MAVNRYIQKGSRLDIPGCRMHLPLQPDAVMFQEPNRSCKKMPFDNNGLDDFSLIPARTGCQSEKTNVPSSG
jgi:hypothetical protein